MSKEKIVLAYSGGLDTSIILKWLQTEKNYDVVAFTADLGQGDEVEEARVKALNTGAVSAYALDLREEFVRDYVFPMFRSAALYEGYYLLGTSIARPLIAKKMVEIAEKEGAVAAAAARTRAHARTPGREAPEAASLTEARHLIRAVEAARPRNAYELHIVTNVPPNQTNAFRGRIVYPREPRIKGEVVLVFADQGTDAAAAAQRAAEQL